MAKSFRDLMNLYGYQPSSNRRLGFAAPADFDKLKDSEVDVFAEEHATLLLMARVHSVANSVVQTCIRNATQLEQAVFQIANWMRDHSPVRFLGAGRALLATTMPGNRLAHAGAQVSFMGGTVPLPNSSIGGGVIAASASGQTVPVLEAMRVARQGNSEIKIIGLADHKAQEFRALCDVFIGVHIPRKEYPNPLSALADTEEYVISELLDGLIVMAGKRLGFDDEAWRRGHEDIGPTGPYSAQHAVLPR